MTRNDHRRKKQKGVVDKYCLGCRYLADLTWGESPDGPDRYCCCDYILRTGKRRPCPAGSGCTVREPKKRTAGAARRAYLFGQARKAGGKTEAPSACRDGPGRGQSERKGGKA